VGGLPCLVGRNAILRFKTVPTSPVDTAAFDAQIRQVYALPDISQSIVNDTDQAKVCCDILAQQTFSQADRQKLMSALALLWPEYS
jgi:hypothetical protein